MQLRLFRHLWGVAEPWEQCFPLFKQQGYFGIEAGLQRGDQATRFAGLLREHGLAYIAQTFTGGNNVAEHVASLAEQARAAKALGAQMVNCHSGRDRFTLEEAESFYRQAVQVERDAGIVIAHETHRGRVFYNPWTTAHILRRVPEVKLCCDLSHWVCVCERLLESESEQIELAARHTVHLHARVGYEEGPQVPDPAAPEYARHLEAHERWWDRVWDAQQQRGDAFTTLTPEFGPPGYLHTLPHTNVPVADLAGVCLWQARRQSARFANRSPRP